MKGEKGDNPKKFKKSYFIGGALIAALVLTLVVFAIPWSTLYPPADTSTVKLKSSFTLIDYRTGEDVSAWVEVSVWTPDDDDLPFDEDDAQTITNFDESSTYDADEMTIDLRSHAVAWLEIDPDFESDYGGYNAVFNALATRDMRKIIGGANYDYRVYVYHAPSNVSIAMLTRGAMVGALDGNFGDARPYNNTVHAEASALSIRGTDGNYTVYLNAPYNSEDGWHAGTTGGDEWDIDDEELEEITDDANVHDYDFDADLQWLKDQSNHRTMAPYYDLTDDTNDQFGDDLEQITNAFAIRFGFNGSVSTTDGNRAQVNITVLERDANQIPIDIVYDAEWIWLIFTEPITVYDESYNFDLQIDFADHIFLGNVTTVRLVVPDDDDNLGAATAMGLMRLVNYPHCS